MTEPQIIARSDHPISRQNIDDDCLKVISRLQRHGHQAYLVGGAVRDLMLGVNPKDFDVGTSAHPRDIKKLFKNCWLIGRRFRLAHIKFQKGQKIIETSTFRRAMNPEERGDDSMPVQSDNMYGTEEEDAFRRDFTMNALFYNPHDFTVIDYTGGVQDLKNKTIRIIGDPATRIAEDPVRMLRAIKFSSRLGLSLDPVLSQAIKDHHAKIALASPARMLEEYWRFLFSHKSQANFQMMHDYALCDHLFAGVIPEVDQRQPWLAGFGYWDQLAMPDEFEHRGMALAILFGPRILQEMTTSLEDENAEENPEATLLLCLERFIKIYHPPRRDMDRCRRILQTVFRMTPHPKKRKLRKRNLTRQAIFPESLQIMEIFTKSRGEDLKVVKEWQALYNEVMAGRPAPKVKFYDRKRRRPARRGKNTQRKANP